MWTKSCQLGMTSTYEVMPSWHNLSHIYNFFDNDPILVKTKKKDPMMVIKPLPSSHKVCRGCETYLNQRMYQVAHANECVTSVTLMPRWLKKCNHISSIKATIPCSCIQKDVYGEHVYQLEQPITTMIFVKTLDHTIMGEIIT